MPRVALVERATDEDWLAMVLKPLSALSIKPRHVCLCFPRTVIVLKPYAVHGTGGLRDHAKGVVLKGNRRISV